MFGVELEFRFRNKEMVGSIESSSFLAARNIQALKILPLPMKSTEKRFPKHRSSTDIVQKSRDRFKTGYALICNERSKRVGVGKPPSNRELGGSALAAAELNGRGRLATGGGGGRGELAAAAARSRVCWTHQETLGLLGAEASTLDPADAAMLPAG